MNRKLHLADQTKGSKSEQYHLRMTNPEIKQEQLQIWQTYKSDKNDKHIGLWTITNKRETNKVKQNKDNPI